MALTRKQFWLVLLGLAVAFSVVDLVLYLYNALSFFILVIFIILYVMALNIARLMARKPEAARS